MIPPLLDMKIYAAFDGRQNKKPLHELCMELLSEQKNTWQDLQQGYESLEAVRVRDITCSGFFVRVQHNPGRIRSTMAEVGEKGINGRPCFLCLNNLPEGQKGILYQEEYLILCNPMPVFSGHLTIAHYDHQPQSMVANIDTFLQLMKDFGSSWTVLYNGPKCGASAPDHLHFQAIPSGNLPVEKEIFEGERVVLITEIDGVQVSRAEGLGREMLVLEGDEPKAMANTFKRIMAVLREFSNTDDEPMMNVAGFHNGKKWCIMVFPRAKHRPDAFFREGDGRVAVSPAVIEMGGVLVTPMEKDFEHLDATIVEGIFGEVSLDRGIYDLFQF
ncbi:MAG: DUF4922 domain-containing protein [Syntrophus sp. (in: bacteria)]|nr:DUF4922 domain-containing protein [Syntrophus sp. (in: bacteria)]